MIELLDMGCSCHISPPCVFCTKTFECERCGDRVVSDEQREENAADLICDDCGDERADAQRARELLREEAIIRTRYARCAQLRAQAAQLDNKSLARKMGCGVRSVVKAISGMPVPPDSGLTPEDVAILKRCASERDRLRSRAALNDVRALAVDFDRTVDEVNAIISKDY